MPLHIMRQSERHGIDTQVATKGKITKEIKTAFRQLHSIQDQAEELCEIFTENLADYYSKIKKSTQKEIVNNIKKSEATKKKFQGIKWQLKDFYDSSIDWVIVHANTPNKECCISRMKYSKRY